VRDRLAERQICCRPGLWISHENKFFAEAGGNAWSSEESGSRSKFYSSDTPETSAQRGFLQNVFCKILLPKNLDLKILRTNNLERQDLASIDRHCLDYDCAIADWGARSDVTMRLWRTGLPVAIVIYPVLEGPRL
jgi:hypothetical protein